MLSVLRQATDSFLGRGNAAITVPTMDGALKPNHALDGAETIHDCVAPVDLASDGQALYLADGHDLLLVEGGGIRKLRSFEKTLTALACLPGGAIAVALDGREVAIFDRPDADAPKMVFKGKGMRAINALSVGDDQSLLATDGSAASDADNWVWDLMGHGATGRLLRLDLSSGDIRPLATKLEYAFGVSQSGQEALVSESWRHRLVAISKDGRKRTALAHLPIYPSRLSPATDGGWWLTGFIARTQLVEFVLREPAYRKRMMAEIAPEHWVAPRLASGVSYKEPMQAAHLRTMGVIKPWAPPQSYGLVIRLDQDVHPVFSLHSRFDGVNHGIVSAVEHDGALYLIAKGPRRLLRLSLADIEKEANL